MQNKQHRRVVRRVALIALLGYALGLALPNPNSAGGSEAGPLDSPALTQHTTPKADTYVLTIRQRAKRWTLKRIHLQEWRCMDEIIRRESRWIPDLHNTQGSGAFGLGQVKGSEHYTAGKHLKQYKVAVRYAIHKHGTLCNALRFHNSNGWY